MIVVAGADLGRVYEAVSLQVTLVINTAAGSYLISDWPTVTFPSSEYHHRPCYTAW